MKGFLRFGMLLTITLVVAGPTTSSFAGDAKCAGGACEATAACSSKSWSDCGHKIKDWLCYGPRGSICSECSCLRKGGCRTPALYSFFLDYPCRPGPAPVACDKCEKGHLHFTKHSCADGRCPASTAWQESISPKKENGDAKPMPKAPH